MNCDVNDFIETITEMANVGGHIEFLDTLLSAHTWSGNRVEYYYSQLDYVKKKLNDKNMYMAVIGEFSSGKSSFINAIIRDDLLKTDVLSSTTSSATMISYRDNLDAIVEYQDGTTNVYSKSIPWTKKILRAFVKPKQIKLKKEFTEYIASVTAMEEVAATVSKVTICHPSDVLANGLVIIDTPGTNVENERHEQVTVNAIKELSDAAIIVISSDRQLPESLLRFIKSNLCDVISKCIFVVNKMDLIRTKEQPRVLQYVETKLKMEFGVEKVNVFPYTSLAILKSKLPEVEFQCEEEFNQYLLKQSLETEEKIYETLKQQRILIQLQKLIILIRDLFQVLATDLATMEQGYLKRHEALEANRIKDLGTFIATQKQMHREALLVNCAPIKQAIAAQIDQSMELLNKFIYDKIYSCTSHNELNAFIKKKKQLESYINNAQMQLEANLNEIMSTFNTEGTKEQMNFEAKFKELYHNLATLGGQVRINEYEASSMAVGMIKGQMHDNITGFKKGINSQTNKEVGASLGGAAAGLAIGTAIFPGVGTLIGGVIGSFASLLFRKSLEDVKADYYAKVSASIRNSYKEAQVSAADLSEQAINMVVSILYYNIDQYFVQYNALVTEMIRRDEEEKRILIQDSNQIKSELSSLKNRQETLDQVRQRLVQ